MYAIPGREFVILSPFELFNPWKGVYSLYPRKWIDIISDLPEESGILYLRKGIRIFNRREEYWYFDISDPREGYWNFLSLGEVFPLDKIG